MQDELNDIQMPYTDPAPGDLVRVVRCKNCRYFGYLKNIPLSCSYWIDVTEANDYCSRGEVKDDEHRSD